MLCRKLISREEVLKKVLIQVFRQTKLNLKKILLRITESADILNGIKWLKLTTIYYKLKAQTELFSAFHTKKKTFMKASERIFI